MATAINLESFTYPQRLDALRATKLLQTLAKQELIGAMDHDDWGLILPPPDRREIAGTSIASHRGDELHAC